MSDPADEVMDLIFGRWRSQTLYAGVRLGLFEELAEGGRSAGEVADARDLDPDHTYRLLRALGSFRLLEELPDGTFRLTERGELLTADHPRSLRGVALLEEGPSRSTHRCNTLGESESVTQAERSDGAWIETDPGGTRDHLPWAGGGDVLSRDRTGAGTSGLDGEPRGGPQRRGFHAIDPPGPEGGSAGPGSCRRTGLTKLPGFSSARARARTA